MKAFHIFESFPPSFGATILVALFFLFYYIEKSIQNVLLRMKMVFMEMIMVCLEIFFDIGMNCRKMVVFGYLDGFIFAGWLALYLYV